MIDIKSRKQVTPLPLQQQAQAKENRAPKAAGASQTDKQVDHVETTPAREPAELPQPPVAALAAPGHKRKVSTEDADHKKASVLRFEDGEEAVTLPSFTHGGFAKVALAALPGQRDEPLVVRKQRTFARGERDAAKIGQRIDAAVAAGHLQAQEALALKVDLKQLKAAVDAGTLTPRQAQDIEADPGVLSHLVQDGTLTAAQGVLLRHTQSTLSSLLKGPTLRAERLDLLRSQAPWKPLGKGAKMQQVVTRFHQNIDAAVQDNILTAHEATQLKLNTEALKKLEQIGVITAEQARALEADPSSLETLVESGQIDVNDARVLRTTSKPLRSMLDAVNERIDALAELQPKTSYVDPQKAARERNLLHLVNSPLAPRNVAVVNGMEYELVKRFDGDSAAVFGQSLPRNPRRDLLRVMGVQVTTALAKAHAQGVAHLDIKPDNVLVDRAQGGFVVADWGLALKPEPGAAMQGARGTPEYMAPEVRQGKAYDFRADVYSVAVLLCHAAVPTRASLFDPKAAKPAHEHLEDLIVHCLDEQGNADLGKLATHANPRSHTARFLTLWHQADADTANFAAAHMLRHAPDKRVSMERAAEWMQQWVPAPVEQAAKRHLRDYLKPAQSISSQVIDKTLEELGDSAVKPS